MGDKIKSIIDLYYNRTSVQLVFQSVLVCHEFVSMWIVLSPDAQLIKAMNLLCYD